MAGMEKDRRQRYLETFLQKRAPGELQELIPVVSRWDEILNSIPGLHRRHPEAHCRVAGLAAGVLTVEADHAAWLQLLQWHEGTLVLRLKAAFPDLAIAAVRFRLVRAGDRWDRPTTVMPEPVKPELTAEEQNQLDGLLADLESLIRSKKGSGAGNSD